MKLVEWILSLIAEQLRKDRLSEFREKFKRKMSRGLKLTVEKFIREHGFLKKEKFVAKAKEFFKEEQRFGDLEQDEFDEIMDVIREIA